MAQFKVPVEDAIPFHRFNLPDGTYIVIYKDMFMKEIARVLYDKNDNVISMGVS